MKNKKLTTIVTLVCLLLTFSINLFGCQQQVQTPTPPANLVVQIYHDVIYLGGDRVLDVNQWGEYRIWVYDRSIRGDADPLVSKEVWGDWTSIDCYHELIYLGNDRVLDWNWTNGDYRIWVYDRNVRGNHDPFPGDPEVYGTWSSIKGPGEEGDVRLIYLNNDRVLEWHENDGSYRIWVYDRSKRGNSDPFPGDPEAYGTWYSITEDDKDMLAYIGRNDVLEVDNDGNYCVWWYNRNLRGKADVLTDCQNRGQWETIKSYGFFFAFEFIYLDNDRLLVREDEGKYRIYVIDRDASHDQDPLPGGPEVYGTWRTLV